jgi:hypothetical protein
MLQSLPADTPGPRNAPVLVTACVFEGHSCGWIILVLSRLRPPTPVLQHWRCYLSLLIHTECGSSAYSVGDEHNRQAVYNLCCSQPLLPGKQLAVMHSSSTNIRKRSFDSLLGLGSHPANQLD